MHTKNKDDNKEDNTQNIESSDKNKVEKDILQKEKNTTESNNKLYTVLIYIKSYDFKLLDIAAKTIYTCIRDGDINCNLPSPRPTKKVKFCIRRAPSIYKASFEKFEHRIHSRLITIKATDNLDKLICLSKADIPRAVNIDIKILDQKESLEISKQRKEIRNRILQKKLEKNNKSHVKNISL